MNYTQEQLDNNFIFHMTNSSYDMAKKYLEQGADINCKSKSALKKAIDTNNVIAISFLIKNNANIKNHKYDILNLCNNDSRLYLAIDFFNYSTDFEEEDFELILEAVATYDEEESKKKSTFYPFRITTNAIVDWCFENIQKHQLKKQLEFDLKNNPNGSPQTKTKI